MSKNLVFSGLNPKIVSSLIHYLSAKADTMQIVPSSVTNISANAFRCTALSQVYFDGGYNSDLQDGIDSFSTSALYVNAATSDRENATGKTIIPVEIKPEDDKLTHTGTEQSPIIKSVTVGGTAIDD